MRVGGFATAIRGALLPVVDALRADHPALLVRMDEYEPAEAFALLESDDLDLALTYDYTLAPASPGPLLETTPLRTTAWGLGVRADDAFARAGGAADLVAYRDHRWIVNSRNSADEEVVRTLASLAGFEPDVAHQIDSLDLVEELVLARHGVGLLPRDRAVRPGVAVLPLLDPPVVHTTYAVVRRGRAAWAPLRVLLERVVAVGAG